MSDSSHDQVRQLLEQRGCEWETVQGGLEGLVAGWEEASAQIEDGYDRGLDEYLTDLDARQLLEEALEVADPDTRIMVEARVRAADERIRSSVDPLDECLWGAKVADSEGWTPEHNWWYFSLPRDPGPMLREDMGGG